MRQPLSMTPVGGGIWRTKYHYSRPDDLLVACMHDGFKVLRFDSSDTAQIVQRFDDHASLAYGADWGEEVNGGTVVASCSFYDASLRTFIAT